MSRRDAVRALALAPLLAACPDAGAGPPPRFYWDPVPSGHWVASGPDEGGQPSAIMLFERIELDDTRSHRDEVILTIRQRLRILRDGGSGAAEITLPYPERADEIVKIHARTLHRDGREFVVPLEDVIRGFELRVGDEIWESRTVIMPGVEDGCLVDLFVQYLMRRSVSHWPVQREIPLLSGELVWRSHPDWAEDAHHHWRNRVESCDIEITPPPDDDEGPTIRFTAGPLPPVPDIPFTLPGSRNETALLFYYGEPNFWGRLTGRMALSMMFLEDQVEDLRKLLRGLERTGTHEEKARGVYADLLELVQIDETVERDRYDSLAEDLARALKEGKGTSQEVTILYWMALENLYVPAYIGYLRDRRTGEVERAARYWQFNRALVSVVLEDGSVVYVVPGQEALPFGELPWYLEGTKVFLIKDDAGVWETTPRSTTAENTERLTVEWNVSADEVITGSLRYELRGEFAHGLRLHMQDLGPAGQRTVARSWLTDLHPRIELAGVHVDGVEELESPLTVRAEVVPATRLGRFGATRTLKPLAIAEGLVSPIARRDREHPCVFEFAYERTAEATVRFPDGWIVEAVPASRRFLHRAGDCIVSTSFSGTEAKITRTFRLSETKVAAHRVDEVHDLFDRRVESDGLAIVARPATSLVDE